MKWVRRPIATPPPPEAAVLLELSKLQAQLAEEKAHREAAEKYGAQISAKESELRRAEVELGIAKSSVPADVQVINQGMASLTETVKGIQRNMDNRGDRLERGFMKFAPRLLGLEGATSGDSEAQPLPVSDAEAAELLPPEERGLAEAASAGPVTSTAPKPAGRVLMMPAPIPSKAEDEPAPVMEKGSSAEGAATPKRKQHDAWDLRA